MDNRIFSETDKTTLEKNINDVGELAFSAGYIKALKDVLDRTNGKVALEISKLILANINKERAREFVKDHPFIFKS